MTPSLLPRGPLFQGLVSGAAGAIGYGLGVFAVWLVRYMRSKETSPPAPRWAWIALVVVGIIGQILMIIYFHVWQDEVRDLNGRAAAGVLGPPADRRAVDRRAVRLRRNRPADRQIGALPGASAGSLCAATGFGRRGGRAAARADHRTAQRHRGAVRDEHAQQHVRGGQRRDRSRLPRADVAAALGRPAVAGQLGVARPSGPGVRRRRADGRRARRSSTASPPSSRSAPTPG